MTGPIGSSAPPLFSDPSGLAGAAGQHDGLRPQVQSRRVSFQLGPLGIRYATDQVLWSPAASSAASGLAASGLAAASGHSDAACDPAGQSSSAAEQSAAAANPQAQAQAAQAQTQAQGPDFARDLRRARLRDARETGQWGQGAEQAAQTYGPDGCLTARAIEQGDAPESGADGEEEAGERQGRQAAAEAFAAPTHLVRRAIGAYLACARGFQSARPMLAATA